MVEHTELAIFEFADAPGYPGFLVAAAKFNGIPFGILANEEYRVLGIFPLDEENVEFVEQMVVPWLDVISCATYQILMFRKNTSK